MVTITAAVQSKREEQKPRNASKNALMLVISLKSSCLHVIENRRFHSKELTLYVSDCVDDTTRKRMLEKDALIWKNM